MFYTKISSSFAVVFFCFVLFLYLFNFLFLCAVAVDSYHAPLNFAAVNVTAPAAGGALTTVSAKKVLISSCLTFSLPLLGLRSRLCWWLLRLWKICVTTCARNPCEWPTPSWSDPKRSISPLQSHSSRGLCLQRNLQVLLHLRLSPRLLSTGRASSGRSSWSCRSCTFCSFIPRYRISNHNRSATSYGLSRPRSCDGDMPESLSWWLLPLLHCGLLYVGSGPSPRKSGRVEPRGTFLH